MPGLGPGIRVPFWQTFARSDTATAIHNGPPRLGGIVRDLSNINVAGKSDGVSHLGVSSPSNPAPRLLHGTDSQDYSEGLIVVATAATPKNGV